VFNQGEGEPLAHDWQMTGAEQLKGRLGHGLDVLRNENGVVVRSRPIWTCYEDGLNAQDIRLSGRLALTLTARGAGLRGCYGLANSDA